MCWGFATRSTQAFWRNSFDLNGIDLCAGVEEHSALDYGVAQTRSRVIISAFGSKRSAAAFIPQKIPRGDLTVRSVIEGLSEPAFSPKSYPRRDRPSSESLDNAAAVETIC